MFENIIVGIAAVIALYYIVQRFRRTFNHSSTQGCGCDKGGCCTTDAAACAGEESQEAPENGTPGACND